MTAVRTSSPKRTTTLAPPRAARPRAAALRVVPPPARTATGRRHVPVAALALLLLLAIAVGLQARQVAGQEHLDEVRAQIRAATTSQVELRSAVAEAESPAKILEAALALGMIEPGAAVAVPAPSPVPTPKAGTG